MPDERWKEISRIYQDAAALEPAARDAYLRGRCGDDEALLDEVRSLLVEDSRAEQLLDPPKSGVHLIGQRLGVYEIQSLLGAGGMGEVYRAHDTKLGRDVAIKVLPRDLAGDADRLSRLEREARVLASLSHPHIAVIHGVEEIDGGPALVLELVQGETLAERIARGPIPISEALTIARQIADALEAAHEHGIIHRDLKPANIILQGAWGPTPTRGKTAASSVDSPPRVCDEINVKVLDFGLAKTIETAGRDVNRADSVDTRGGLVLGTAAYMSPEQARGKPVDKRTDIWAFGCVLFEMLTAKRAFEGDDVTATLARILEREPDWHHLPANTSPSIRRLLRRCLEKDARKRFKDIGDIAIEIEDASLTAAEAIEPPARRSRVRRLGWLAAGALAGGVAASGLWVLGPVAVRETEAIRFSVETPVMPNPFALSVSPDGRQIAFAAAASGGPTMLYVRPLGSLEAKLLPGTEGAAHPFWSPDSRQVGFAVGVDITAPSSARRLKAIEASGGSSRVLTDLAGRLIFNGATWNSDGVIVFSDDGVLHRVSDAGGKTVRLSRPNRLRAEVWPQFLPDGRRYLYLVIDPVGDHLIAVGSLDGHEPKELMRSESAGLYAPPGFLLFLRQRTLMAQRFDAANLRFQGEPNRVESNVFTNPASGRVAFAVSHTGILAYRAGDMEATPRKLVRTDRNGSSELIGDLLPSGHAFGAPYIRLSPDGTRVAFDDRPRGREDVWIYDLQRNLRFPLTRDQGDDHQPVWSPDSTKLGFDSNRNGFHVLYEQAADGATPERILVAPEPGMNHGLLDWTSEFIVFTRGKPDAKTNELWAQPLSGDRKPFAYLLSDVDSRVEAATAAVSPNSRWIAYTVNDGSTSQVVIRSFPDPIRHRQQISMNGGSCPRWRRDGRELFYLDSSRKMVAVAVAADYTFKVKTSVELFAAPGGFSPLCGYDVTQDGQHFLFNIAGAPPQSPITIVSNWLAELKKDTKD